MDTETTTNAPSAPHASGPSGSIPKRKPVPAATAPDTEPAIEHTLPTKNETPSNEKPRQKTPFYASLLPWWGSQKRSRKLLYIGLVALILLALIIGLAVGLTVGKK